MSVELKILVPLEEWTLLKKIAKSHENCSGKSNEEWEELKRIEREHQKCQSQLHMAKTNKLSTTEGAGAFIDGSGDHTSVHTGDLTFVMPSSHQNEEKNTDGNCNSFEKDVIVDQGAEVPSRSSTHKTLSKSEVLENIQEKFKTDASSLLDKLAHYPLQFSYDSNGILTIFGTTYPGKELLCLLK